MTRAQAAAWATVAALAGVATFAYLLSSIPPRLPAGSVNVPAVLGFFAALLLLVTGLGAVVALALHERWPQLAGVDRRYPGMGAAPEAALRQGFLAAVAAAALAGLSMAGLFDAAFVIAALVLVGLVEAFWQTRPFDRP